MLCCFARQAKLRCFARQGCKLDDVRVLRVFPRAGDDGDYAAGLSVDTKARGQASAAKRDLAFSHSSRNWGEARGRYDTR